MSDAMGKLVQLLYNVSERVEDAENENKILRTQLRAAEQKIHEMTVGNDFDSHCRRIVLQEQQEETPSKIEVIKQLRAISGAGLKEAKEGIGDRKHHAIIFEKPSSSECFPSRSSWTPRTNVWRLALLHAFTYGSREFVSSHRR